MPKAPPPLEVLVLGEHPSAYLASAMLAEKHVRVAHATIPNDPVADRLVLINPDLFDLDPMLSPLKRKIASTTIYGIRFLGADAGTSAEHRGKAGMACLAHYADVRDAMRKLAEQHGVPMHAPRSLQIGHLDEAGVEVQLDEQSIKPRMLIVAGRLPAAQQRTLGMPETWGPQVMRRVTLLKLKGAKYAESQPKPLVLMSLDLGGDLCWAWMMSHDGQHQLVVEEPVETAAHRAPAGLLRQWVHLLHTHGAIKTIDLPFDDATQLDMPMAGALEQECVANRTLLIGPAGGFYSGSGEDIYPACWSVIFAVDTARKALKEPHLQDALAPYRQKWRTTLGEYLRGPRANLRFLLPLIYRNAVMTQRMSEAILQGKGVVR